MGWRCVDLQPMCSPTTSELQPLSKTRQMRLIGTANVNQLMHHVAETSTHQLRQEVGQKEATDLPLNDSTAHREKQVQLVQPHQHDLVELKAIKCEWTEGNSRNEYVTRVLAQKRRRSQALRRSSTRVSRLKRTLCFALVCSNCVWSANWGPQYSETLLGKRTITNPNSGVRVHTLRSLLH